MILKKSNKFLALIFIFKALAFSTDVPYSVSDTGTYENFVYLSQRIDVISKSISSSSTTISYPISVANGGTGATTASGARSHLEVPNLTGTGASGTWAINITGSANSANTANSSNSSLTASTASYSNYASTAGYAPGDNLGNHIATMTITAPYGISASTISVSSITASGSVTANTYYGDGSHLTGISGAGDVYKASTQTFTGGNTFTGSVTVSSLTATQETVSTITVNTAIIGMAPMLRAYVTFGYTGSSVTVYSSYNVASITRFGQGYYTVIFSNALADRFYAISATATAGSSSPDTTTARTVQIYSQGGITTNSFALQFINGVNAAQYDPYYATVSVFR